MTSSYTGYFIVETSNRHTDSHTQSPAMGNSSTETYTHTHTKCTAPEQSHD